MPTPTLTHVPIDEKFVSFLQGASIVPQQSLTLFREKSLGNQDVFEHILIDEGYMSDAELGVARAQLNGWHSVDLQKEPVDSRAKTLMPESFAKAKRLLVFHAKDEVVHVATSRPNDGVMRRLLEKKFPPSVRLHYVTDSVLYEKLNVLYDSDSESRLTNLTMSKKQSGGEDETVSLLDTILLHAAREHASDIHIEPGIDDVVVRERVDGILRRVTIFSKETHGHLLQRMKVLSHLPTDEHSIPQDGKFTVDNLDGRRADVRVSITPTSHGENVVMRMLISEHHSLSLESLGMDPEQLAIMTEEMERAWGMILVTGPTGSGKTTSLYATVLKIRSEDISISTIEDPVEYDLPGTNQIQVNEKVGLTFAAGLRSLMRHDPDVILVGEIRDTETASIAVNAALTGHMVFSTLHTNDAPSAVPRLCDMGIEPFLLSSTINLVIAQRLVRRICVRCKEGYAVTKEDLLKVLPEGVVTSMFGKKTELRFYRGKGCAACSGKGYHGRSGIFEFLRMNDAIRTLVMKRADADTIRNEATRGGMRTMMEDGLFKVLQGQTTLEEILRVTRL